jgi:tetratricopeptide (TPR) repeat protein
LPLAFAQLGQGLIADAADSYGKVASALTPSRTASGLADIAVFEGRYATAAKMLSDGAAADLADGNRDAAAAKFAALAHAELLRGRRPAAASTATTALEHGRNMRVRFLAGRLLAQTGNVPRAKELAAELRRQTQAEAQAYARILEANVALEQKDVPTAIKLLGEADGLLSTWIGKFDLGRAYLAAELFAEAESAFDVCLTTRRGEAISLFLDEEPTYGYLPMAYYFQGRARQGMGAGFATSYKTYLEMRGAAGEDPLLADLRRQVK